MSVENAITQLSDLLGERLSVAKAVRMHHGENEAHFALALPDAVAFPETTQDVSDILRICHAESCPVVGFGTGSSLEGQHLPVDGGISVDFSRMNRVLEVRSEDMLAVVQPGVTRQDLNTELRATGLFFSVDPGANASLGGMAATRASGTTAVRYGTMRENILALEAVMADGTIVRTGSAARKSSAGYDLTHLLIGSEGTLGLITELTVRLFGVPEETRAATCRFSSIDDAVNAAILTIQSGVPVARIELLDEVMQRGFNIYTGDNQPEAPSLFLEFHGSAASVDADVANFSAIAEDFGADALETAASTEARNTLWKMRHNAHFAVRALAPQKRTLSTDVCVPISHLAEAVLEAQAGARDLDLLSTIVGHVGDGNFHCGVLFDPQDADETARVAEFSELLARSALRLGGTVTGEHGIGLGKQKYMQAEHGAALSYMRAVKAAFDPKGILNPGKMLPPLAG